MLTLSQAELAEACPGALVLYRTKSINEATRRGTAAHAYLRRVPDVGRDQALAEVEEEEFRPALAALDLSRLPLDPSTYRPEISYAYNVEQDAARELGQDLGRWYPDTAEAEVVGTADLVAVVPGERVILLDWKTGRIPPKAKTCLQLHSYALCAARVHGLSTATVGIVHVPLHDSDLEARFDLAELDGLDLDATAARLYEVWSKVREAREAYDAGKLPELVEGPQCHWCPAFFACPTKQVLAGILASEGGVESLLFREANHLQGFNNALTSETAAKAWNVIERVRELTNKVASVIEEYGKTNPFRLGDDRLFGPHPYSKTTIKGLEAAEALGERYGEDVAAAARVRMQTTLTKAAVQDSLRGWVQRTEGAKISKEIQTAMEYLEQRGAASTRTTQPVGPYQPKEAKK